MPKKRMTWEEKLHSVSAPIVKELRSPFGGYPVGTKMLIPSPLQLEEYVCGIPKGEVRDAKSIRADLAKQFGAETTCPACTGLYMRIVAEVALEKIANGEVHQTVTPFWRGIPVKSPLAPKLSCGVAYLQTLQENDRISQ